MNHIQPDLRLRRAEDARAAGTGFLDSARRRIVVDLLTHLRQGAGPMVVLGESGSGRTRLLRQVAAEAAAQRLPLVVVTGDAEPSSLLAAIARLDTSPTTHPEMPGARLRRPPALLIDDAAACPVAVWHRLAALLRAGPAATASPAIILALPPEMLHWLRDLSLIEPGTIEARVHRLTALAPADVALFVGQRLEAAGLLPPDVLPADAIDRITVATGGLPGPLDAFCGALIDIACLRGSGWVSVDLIDTALAGASTRSVEAPAVMASAAVFPDGRDSQLDATPPSSGPAATMDEEASGGPRPTMRMADELPPPRPPLFPEGDPYGTLYRSRRRRRRRWRLILGAATPAVAVLVVAAAFQLRPDGGDGIAVQTPPPPAVAIAPTVPERFAAIQAGQAVLDSGGGEREAAPAPITPPRITDEERPVIFTPAPPAERPRTPVPPSPPATKAKAAAKATETPAKQPSANKRPGAAPAAKVAAKTEAEAAPAIDDPAAPPRPVKDIIAIGDEFRASGDMAWARKYYEAAEARGSAQAKRALAETYDPRYVDGSDRPDAAVARDLYDQAARHGDRGAVKEREALDQWLDEGR